VLPSNPEAAFVNRTKGGGGGKLHIQTLGEKVNLDKKERGFLGRKGERGPREKERCSEKSPTRSITMAGFENQNMGDQKGLSTRRGSDRSVRPTERRGRKLPSAGRKTARGRRNLPAH